MDCGVDGAVDGDNTIPGTSDANLDRSKVHILLCDKDPDSALHIMKLLQQCLYRVTCVKSAGQVLEVLRSCSYEVDLILSEVELPKEKGLKMLKHIIRKEQLHRIPIVIMSTRDEMGLIVKCLSLGAVDYLLKPLRLNELLNLWTHTWRRRRMLGLSEKHSPNKKLQFPFDLVVSETSESNNTNGTNILSDDIDDVYFDDEPATGNFVPRRVEPEGNPQLELSLRISLDMAPPEASSSKEAVLASFPRKTEFKIAQSSAFLSYAKANESAMNARQGPVAARRETEGDAERPSARQSKECHSANGSVVRPEGIRAPLEEAAGFAGSFGSPSVDARSANSLCFSTDGEMRSRSDSDRAQKRSGFEHLSDDAQARAPPGFRAMMMMPPPPRFDAGLIPALAPMPMHPEFAAEGSVSVVTGIPLMQPPPPALGQGPPTPYMFPYFAHASTHLVAPSFGSWLPAANHVANTTTTTTTTSSSSATVVLGQQLLCRSERREAALDKFRRKRRDRCFDKKIRYVSRKKLAEQRPRIRGQFVKRESGGSGNRLHAAAAAAAAAFEEYEDDADDDDNEDHHGFEDPAAGSSPESVAEDS